MNTLSFHSSGNASLLSLLSERSFSLQQLRFQVGSIHWRFKSSVPRKRSFSRTLFGYLHRSVLSSHASALGLQWFFLEMILCDGSSLTQTFKPSFISFQLLVPVGSPVQDVDSVKLFCVESFGFIFFLKLLHSFCTASWIAHGSSFRIASFQMS